MKTIVLICLLIYWVTIYVYLIVWSVSIRKYVKKNNISSLDTTDPITYKVGKLTDFQKLGEVLLYEAAMFCGIFMFFIIPTKNMIKDHILPDD